VSLEIVRKGTSELKNLKFLGGRDFCKRIKNLKTPVYKFPFLICVTPYSLKEKKNCKFYCYFTAK
jgi:hypothetical protein